MDQATRVDRRRELSTFLRTRRARLSPRDVGLPDVGRRRTPGLRREEVATLAGVGVSWFTWLEQGRDINASADVVDAIGRALQLTDVERTHLHLLAGLNPPPTSPAAAEPVPIELRDLIDAWMPRPAILRDLHWNLVAVNDATREVFGIDETDRNCILAFFTNDRYRSMHASWEAVAPSVVAAFRADAAHFPDDPEFARIVTELSSATTDFTPMWERYDVGQAAQMVKAIAHPTLGDLYFDTTTLRVVDRPHWFLELYNPRPR